MNRSVAVFVALLSLPAVSPRAQSVRFQEVPDGYQAGTVPLGSGNSASALAPDPSNENYLYVSGVFDGASRIVRLNLTDGNRTVVFNCPTSVTVSGLAVSSGDVLYVSDNANDHLYVLQDYNPQDGDFDDPDELRELIEPILTHPTYGWTGSSILVVPPGSNRLGLAPGTVLFQSEDGETTQGEVLAVIDPLTSPTYQPAGGAYFSGFNFGGGLVTDSQGRLLVASSFYPESGKIWICEDLSGDAIIGDGESHVLVPRVSFTTDSVGLSALTIDENDQCYVCVGGGFAGSARTEIRRFDVAQDPLPTTATVTTFATLNSPYVSAAVFNTKTKSFRPFTLDGATVIIAASDPFFGNPDYLLTLRAQGSSGVRQWTLY